MSSSVYVLDQAVRVTNGWEVLLLVFPPVLSLIYAFAAALFCAVWGEQAFWSMQTLSPVLQRNTLCLLAVSVALHPASVVYTSDGQEQEREIDVIRLFFAMACFWAVAFYYIRQTRIEVVEGGPSPQIGVDESDESEVKVVDSNNGKQDKLVILVTGANAGIGKETVRELFQYYDERQQAVTILLACRNTLDGQRAILDIAGEDSASGSMRVQMSVVELDLSNLDSVRKAADQIQKEYPRVDTLICNAGVMMAEQRTTGDGYELVFQVNYLGHYLLTRLLLEGGGKKGKRVTRSQQKQQHPCQRVLWITSSTYRRAGQFSLEDPFCQTGTRSYSLFGQYAYSKLAQILFIQELARHCSDENKNVFCAAIHPGLVRTNVVRNMPWFFRMCNTAFAAGLQTLQKTPAQGAWNSFYCATMPIDEDELVASKMNGQYWVNRHVEPVMLHAQDAEAASDLWNQSATWVGLD